MFFRLLLLFTLIPLVELALLIQLGRATSLGTTIAIVLLTGILGAWLARREGLRTWRAIHEGLDAGRVPSEELVEGLLILVAGAVLVTPGLLTDAVGFAMLIRPLRRVIRRRLTAAFQRRVVIMSPHDAGRPDYDVIDMDEEPRDS